MQDIASFQGQSLILLAVFVVECTFRAQVMRFAEAKEDCDSALNLELNVKTLLRRGTAWLGLQEIDSARRDFKHVLSLEPNNRCVSGCGS